MRLNNPISEMEKKGIKNYMNMLDANEKVGFIEIPKIDQKIPIYIGTSEEVLLKGAGHLEGTSLPIGGKNTHSVITAHSGLPEARLFTDLDKMEIGDKFYINILEEVIAYKVNQILVIDPYDFEHILVVKDKDYSTLLTCTPTSINSHRLLVRGERVPYVKPVKEEMDSKKVDNINEKLLMGSIVIAIFIVLVFLYVLYKKKLIKINKNNKV